MITNAQKMPKIRRKMRKVISIGLIILLTGCVKINVLSHDEDMAAKNAEEFANIAFIEKDFQKAYDLTSEGFRNYKSIDEFIEVIKLLHPQEYPAITKATEFEPMPGQSMMNIFLDGQNGNEKFYYRIVMEGTKDTGYKVSGVMRGSGPYPFAKTRKKLSPNK